MALKSVAADVDSVGVSGWARPLGAQWAPVHLLRSETAIFHRFLLSRKALISLFSIARMMVRRLTFAMWAASAGDMGKDVGIAQIVPTLAQKF